MWKPCIVARALLVGLMILVVDLRVVSAQDYPNKPIRLITSVAGGATDIVVRQIAQEISGPLGQQVLVVNYPSGNTPGIAVAQAAPDGYTLLAAGSTFLIGQFLDKPPFDPVKDFAPVTLTNRSPYVLIVHPSLPVKSVKDLIALAKAKPGALNYASAGAGSGPHLAAELLKSMAGINIVRIPYKGGGAVITAIQSGEVPMAFLNASTVTPFIKSGRIKALAVSSAEPSPLAPGLPTVASAGLPGFETITINGIFAPAKTPAPIMNRLYEEVVRFLSKPDVKERYLTLGVEVVGSSPEGFATTIRSEVSKWGKIIKDASIKAD